MSRIEGDDGIGGYWVLVWYGYSELYQYLFDVLCAFLPSAFSILYVQVSLRKLDVRKRHTQPAKTPHARTERINIDIIGLTHSLELDQRPTTTQINRCDTSYITGTRSC